MTPEQEKTLRALAASSLPGSFLLVDSIRAAVAEIDGLRAEVAKHEKLLFDQRLEATHD